jgi:hypothetical protein
MYLTFLEEIFKVKFEIINFSDFEKNINGSTEISGHENEYMFVKIICPNGTVGNKHYVAFHTCLRYLWYSHYTNIASIATNLYKLRLFPEATDILAIASSYQKGNDRGLLPCDTISLEGLLFFRNGNVMLKELTKEQNFNGIFYKYPIYFDPIVISKGSFFDDSEIIIKSKDTIGRLASVEKLEDIPISILHALEKIKDDYINMRAIYVEIVKQLDGKNYSLTKSNPIMLSKKMKAITTTGVDSVGMNVKIKIETQGENIVTITS